MEFKFFSFHGFQYSWFVFTFIVLIILAPVTSLGNETNTTRGNVTNTPTTRSTSNGTVKVKASDVTQKLLSLFLKEPLAVINVTFPTLEKKPSLLNSLFGSNLDATRDTPIRPTIDNSNNTASVINSTANKAIPTKKNSTESNGSKNLTKTTTDAKVTLPTNSTNIKNTSPENMTVINNKTLNSSTVVKPVRSNNSTDVKNAPTKNSTAVKIAPTKNSTAVKITPTKNSTDVNAVLARNSTDVKNVTSDPSQKRTVDIPNEDTPLLNIDLFAKENNSTDILSSNSTRGIINEPTLCNNSTDIRQDKNCRTTVVNPHALTSSFQGSVGISEIGKKGKMKKLGGEETSGFNETINFNVDDGGKNKTTYNYQNLTDSHYCSGCLEGKHLIKHNKTSPVPRKEESVYNKTKDGKFHSNNTALFKGKHDNDSKSISLEDNQQFIKNSTGYYKTKDKLNMTLLSENNKGNISSALSSGEDFENNTSKLNETFDWENKLFRKRCNPIRLIPHDLHRRMYPKQRDSNVTSLYISCITKRRLISNRVTHTKTKKNGKLVSDTTKDENEEKKKKNGDRAQANQERAKANEDRVHQSEQNDQYNKQKGKENEKILQEILRGDHGKPPANITEEETRNYENLTAKLDPSMIPDNRIDPPPEDRKDEEVGMIGMDPRPAIEHEKSPINNKTKNGKEKNKQLHTNNSTSKDENEKENKNKNITAESIHNQDNENHFINNTGNPGNITNINSTADDDDDIISDQPTRSILAFGDSLTKGLYGVNRYNPYTIRLQEWLEEENRANNDKKKEIYALYNEGVNSECVCNEMTKRLPATLDRYNDQKKKIDLVIILGGTNDLLKSECGRKCDVFESVKKMHKMVHERGMKSVVVTILKSTLPEIEEEIPEKEYADTLWDINQQLRGYVKENPQKMVLCDLADEFPRKASISVDKIHPTKEGYDKIGEIVYDCIKDFKW